MTEDELAEQERRTKRIAIEDRLVNELRAHMNMEDDRNSRWHVGREVPMAVLVVLALQTFGVIWWAATISSEQRAQKEMVTTAKLVQTEVDRRQDEEVQRSEGRLLLALEKVNVKLDRLIERNGK